MHGPVQVLGAEPGRVSCPVRYPVSRCVCAPRRQDQVREGPPAKQKPRRRRGHLCSQPSSSSTVSPPFSSSLARRADSAHARRRSRFVGAPSGKSSAGRPNPTLRPGLSTTSRWAADLFGHKTLLDRYTKLLSAQRWWEGGLVKRWERKIMYKKPHENRRFSSLVGFSGRVVVRVGRGGETREIVLAEKNQGEATNTIMRRERRRSGPNDSGCVHTHRHDRRSRRGFFFLEKQSPERKIRSQVAGALKRDRHT